MKTKLFFAAFGLLSFLQPLTAQEYHPMLNNATWILRDYVSCCRMPETKTIAAGEEVVIDGVTYKKFIDSFSSPGNSNYIVYLREDEDQRKVYSLVNGTEVVLYDFSLLQGDVYGDFNVDVDYIEINGLTRKRIKLSRYDENYGINLTQTWIEGVGSPAHPFRPTVNMYNALSGSGGRSINLVCSFQDGQHIYGNEDCETLMLGNDEFNTTEVGIVFAPNPLQNQLTIKSESSLNEATLKLYNLQGQLVREILHLSGNQNTIDSLQLKTGLYFGQLYEKKGKLIKSVKLLVE